MQEMIFNTLIPELSVKDYDKSIAFYVQTLGFEIAYSREADRFAMIVLDTAQIMIEEINNHWYVGELEYPLGRGINFQIEVKNVQNLVEKLQKNNIPLFREIEENWYEVNGKKYGNKEFLVQDPDGYLLRFSEDIGIRD
jgi:catechol 2,3-dioxygenase-like lactoylglutathione lyase family enzyme